jgi:hypothetical protein
MRGTAAGPQGAPGERGVASPVVVALALAALVVLTLATAGPALADRLACELPAPIARVLGGEPADCAGEARLVPTGWQSRPQDRAPKSVRPPRMSFRPPRFERDRIDLLPGGRPSIRVLEQPATFADRDGRLLARIPAGTRFVLDWTPHARIRPLTPLVIPSADGRRSYRVTELRQLEPFDVWTHAPDVAEIVTDAPLAPEDREDVQAVARRLFLLLLLRSRAEARSVPDDPRVALLERASARLDEFWRAWLGPNYRQPGSVTVSGNPMQRTGGAPTRYTPEMTTVPSTIVIGLGQFGDAGNGAIAYALAHLWGHHVQHLVGAAAQRLDTPAGERQADCLAGAWMSQAVADRLLTTDDLHEVERWLRRAPEPLTHGPRADRVAAFRQGLATDQPNPLVRCGVTR